MSCIDISIENSFDLENPLYIDLRSPSEWLEGNIPGSVNIPIFNDQERAEIGTLYKNTSEQAATDLGVEIAAPKLPMITKAIQAHAVSRSIIIYCWRGGMRSKSIATIMQLLSSKIYRLEGGYRSYRNYVVENLAKVNYEQPFIVLQGMTGVGKTIILERLQRDGYPVLNFEGLAGHRGSVFGAIGLKSVNKQKQFEALLWERLKEIGNTAYYIIEAESKRIGKVTLPDKAMEAKVKGVHVLLEASTEIRTNRLFEEYVHNSSIEQLSEELKFPIEFLRKKLLANRYEQLMQWLNDEDYYAAIYMLLEEYYDPRYIHTFNQYQGHFHIIDASDIDLAVNALKDFINSNLINPVESVSHL